MNEKSERILKIYKKLEKAKVSDDDHDSTQEPFYMFDKKSDFTVGHDNSIEVPEGLNRNVKTIYDILGDPKKEIYFNEWTMFSLNKAMNVYKEYCDNGQTNVFDIGFCYIGMGHILLVACDLTTHLLFYHRGGGSNGYDSESNFQDTIKNGSKDHQQLYFYQWFYKNEYKESLNV
jgi:hypothetical protein